MTGKVIHLRLRGDRPNAGLRNPALLAAHVERWHQGATRGREQGRRIAAAVTERPFGRHSPEVLTGAPAEAGRIDQADGRHTQAYRSVVLPPRGMYPLGGARRVTADNDTGMDDDRGHSDANQRYRLDADGKVTR